MAKGKKFNRKVSTTTPKFNYDPKTETPMQHHKHPIFCLKYLHPDFDIDKCNDEEKLALINQLSKLSKVDWQTIEYSDRHGLGTEKINIDSLKFNCPSFITGDVNFLLALRFYKKMPFLIHRDKFLAHIIFIDPKGKVYNH